MGIFKKADAEIRVRVTRKGEETENMVESYGKTVELCSGFEAICRGLIDGVLKQGGRVEAAIFVAGMEKALRDSIGYFGIKTADEMLEELLKNVKEDLEEGKVETVKVNSLEELLDAIVEDLDKIKTEESGEANV